MVQEYKYNLAWSSGSESLIRLQIEYWLEPLSHLIALLGKDPPPSCFMWLLARFSSMLTIAQRPLLVPHHVGLSIWQLATRQLASSEKAREKNQKTKEKHRDLCPASVRNTVTLRAAFPLRDTYQTLSRLLIDPLGSNIWLREKQTSFPSGKFS